MATVAVSFFVCERSDTVIIGAILALTIGLGSVKEFRAERAVEPLHGQLRHGSVVRRDGEWVRRDVVEVVRGDIVQLQR